MAAKKKITPLSRNIVRHTNKNGDYYYYNYKQNKITSGDSWESQNARIKKRKEEIEEQERKHRQYLRRKREEEAEREQERKRRQYLKRKREAEKEREQEEKHRKYLKRKQQAKKKKAVLAPVPKGEKEFPSNVYFYDAIAEFNDPVFDGVQLTIDVNDPQNGFSESFSDLPEEFSAWFTMSGTFTHLREYHNGSPPGAFKLMETDNLTFAKYTFIPTTS